MREAVNVPKQKASKGLAYCPICTHTVETPIVIFGKRTFVKPGQKCPRCGSSLEAGWIVGYEVAA